MKLALDQIRIDGGTQPRAAIQDETVKDYAAAMADGAKFPPLVVYYDGTNYWLADGFHRFHAARHAGKLKFEVEVHQGRQRDAILYSVGANATHGLRRTNEDKRRAIDILLTDEEWGRWSDSVIARRVGVDHKTVSARRVSLGNFPSENGDLGTDSRDYVTKHGTPARMNTERIGSGKRGPAVGSFTPDVDTFYDEEPASGDPEFGPAFGSQHRDAEPAPDPYDLGGLEAAQHHAAADQPEAEDEPTWPERVARTWRPDQLAAVDAALEAITSVAEADMLAGNRKGAFRRAITAMRQYARKARR